jgi:hypothetical protein
VKSLIPERQERELHGICNFPNSVAPTFPVYEGDLGQELKLQNIFLTLLQLILLTMMQVNSMIHELHEKELHVICNFPTL